MDPFRILHCRSYGHVLPQRGQRSTWEWHIWRRERRYLVQFTLFRVIKAGECRWPVRVSEKKLLQELQGRQFVTTAYPVSGILTLGHAHMLIDDIRFRYECGGQKKFRCLMCGKAFSQSTHLKRHLESGVCIKYYHWEQGIHNVQERIGSEQSYLI